MGEGRSSRTGEVRWWRRSPIGWRWHTTGWGRATFFAYVSESVERQYFTPDRQRTLIFSVKGLRMLDNKLECELDFSSPFGTHFQACYLKLSLSSIHVSIDLLLSGNLCSFNPEGFFASDCWALQLVLYFSSAELNIFLTSSAISAVFI